MNKPPRWWQVTRIIASLIVGATVVVGVSTMASDPAAPIFVANLIQLAKTTCPALIVVASVIFLLIPWSSWKDTVESDKSAVAGNAPVGECEGEEPHV